MACHTPYSPPCRVKAGTVTFRDKLYRFLDSPTSSLSSKLFGFFILIMSIGSVISYGYDSTRQARHGRRIAPGIIPLHRNLCRHVARHAVQLTMHAVHCIAGERAV
jgi:hypothetical protein